MSVSKAIRDLPAGEAVHSQNTIGIQQKKRTVTLCSCNSSYCSGEERNPSSVTKAKPTRLHAQARKGIFFSSYLTIIHFGIYFGSFITPPKRYAKTKILVISIQEKALDV